MENVRLKQLRLLICHLAVLTWISGYHAGIKTRQINLSRSDCCALCD